MSPLRAKVRRVTGYTKHTSAAENRELSPAVLIRIVPYSEGAFLLLRFDGAGRAITDTWHETLEQAKRQALVEYEVGPEDWLEEVN